VRPGMVHSCLALESKLPGRHFVSLILAERAVPKG
jgi:hypothetical protein